MLSPQLLELLREWWKEGHRRGVMLPRGWLFPSRNPILPLSARQMNRGVHAATQAAGITKRVTVHTLRHYLPFRTMSGDVVVYGGWSKNIRPLRVKGRRGHPR